MNARPPESSPPSFDEMRRILRALPGPDQEAVTRVVEREGQLTKPAGALGRLEQIAEWLAGWQGRAEPRVERPRVAVFAGTHGVAARGVSAYPPEVTGQMVQNFLKGGAAINQLAQAIDADLRIYELDLDHPTADFTRGPAMSETRAANAMAYGMMAAEPGIDVLCLGEMGIANTTTAATLCAALFGGSGADWAGPGTGVRGPALERKIAVIDEALAFHRPLIEQRDPLALLAAVGGEEFAAIAGAVLAARMGRIPVLLDGYACTAAAAVLFALDRRALAHCLVAHRSAEPGHARLLEAIGHKPLLDLDMRLGEASAAALAVPLLKAAAACHNGMATFADAGVSRRAPG
ncbi:nicotinate-nucleotide--dimethylbenzimidazole phosphoribosyltransferase [Reyranella sp.]|uniref:nicotinate-nucleotide--dimethylbenzimidazole phosphoribosyltransferase n=1 Tax=Reyranella sp. TaxID=1929291 RepID=UPI003BAD3C11